MDIQKHLLYVTKLEADSLNSSKIRGVTAYWEDKTACISFYFQGEITESDIETASDTCIRYYCSFS